MLHNKFNTLRQLREAAEGQEIDGWRDVYIDNARRHLPVHTYRSHLSELSKSGLYRPIDNYAWGSVKMTDK